MRIFSCPSCSGALYFHNLACGCGHAVSYDPDADAMGGGGVFCANRTLVGCNWRAEAGGTLCRACAMTRVTPDRALPREVARWAEGEAAKRWVLANLGRWGWFGPADQGARPEFHFLSETTPTGEVAVSMGHAAGVITLNVAEADAAIRVERREALGEPYRTLMGHVRHEVAHFLQLRMAASEAFLHDFRDRFGDERDDYAAALGRHYDQGPPPDWAERHISAYASAHAHEDWAETLAHMLHLTDILDSAIATGLLPNGRFGAPRDPYAAADAAGLIGAAVELGLALNHVNRAMGLPDLYPFVLSAEVRDKLAFVHDRLRAGPNKIERAGPEAAA